jgi:hypothetical protein
VGIVPRLLGTERESSTREGDTVRFHLSDVFLPSLEDLQTALQREAEVEGTIVDFSDSGSKPCAFAVVEVCRKQTVIVPVFKLQIVTRAEAKNDA